MTKTLLVNLLGAPGAGKSTMAARLFVALKDQGISCEMAREYIKTWAYEGKVPDAYDQIYITSKQAKIERVLYGKVKVILCDAPLELGSFYEKMYADRDTVAEYVRDLRTGHEEDVKVFSVLVERDKPFAQEGRYCSEEGSNAFATTLKHAFEASPGLGIYTPHRHIEAKGTVEGAQEVLREVLIALDTYGLIPP